jgi:bacterioferritin-associated ferredoxin/ferredoxin
VCKENIIHTDKDLITGLPKLTDPTLCKGCMNCVAICPGLAATLVDYRKDGERPLVTLAYEISRDLVKKGNTVTINDVDGNFLAQVPVERVLTKKEYPGTLLVQVKLDRTIAKRATGIKVQERAIIPEDVPDTTGIPDDAVICRCERVTAGEIRSAIKSGVRDMNELKAINRTGMGACGSKTCRPMVWGIFRDEGVDLKQTTDRIDRPLFVEVPLGTFAGVKGGKNE